MTTLSALIFDTETSGLFDYSKRADAEGQPRMVSIAAALLDSSGAVLSEFYQLIKPDGWEQQFIDDCKAGTGAFAINKLTWEQLNDTGIPIDHALMQFDALFDRSEGITSYGISFDSKIVRAEQRRAGRPDRYGERPTFCIQQTARKLVNEITGTKMAKNPKLAEAVQVILGGELVDAHNAQADRDAAIELYRKMLTYPDLMVWKKQESKLKEEA